MESELTALSFTVRHRMQEIECTLYHAIEVATMLFVDNALSAAHFGAAICCRSCAIMLCLQTILSY